MTAQIARGAPAGHVPLPTVTRQDWDRQIRWWRTEADIPRQCRDCGAGLSNEPPQSAERFGEVFCLLGCGRQYAWISGIGWGR